MCTEALVRAHVHEYSRRRRLGASVSSRARPKASAYAGATGAGPPACVKTGDPRDTLPLATRGASDRDQPLTKARGEKQGTLRALPSKRVPANMVRPESAPTRMSLWAAASARACRLSGVHAQRGVAPGLAVQGKAWRPTRKCGLGPAPPGGAAGGHRMRLEPRGGCGVRECECAGRLLLACAHRTASPGARKGEQAPAHFRPGCKPRGSGRWRLQAAPARTGGPPDRKCFSVLLAAGIARVQGAWPWGRGSPCPF